MRINIKKFITWVAIGFVSVLVNTLIADRADTVPQTHSPQLVPTYAGFADIQTTKNSFVIVGDTQSTSHWEFWRERNDKERKLIVDEITRREPAFVVHLGDLTACGPSKKHWQQFDELHKEFHMKKIPYFPILGNHEFYGNDKRALKNYFLRFPHLSERRWYSFTWENIGFILVDSNFSCLTTEENGQQRKWYIEELERFERDEKVDYVIVCCHAPPFTNSRVVRPNEKVKAFFGDPFLKYSKSSVFFSGHSHSYERFQIEGKFFVVSGGGGGPRHKVSINSPKRFHHDLFLGPEIRFFHFIEVKVLGSTLAYNVFHLAPDDPFGVTDPLKITKARQDKMSTIIRLPYQA